MERKVGTTTAAAGTGTAFGGAAALLIVELFNLNLSDSGVLALGLVLSVVGAFIGGWLAPSKKKEVEEYLGSVMTVPSAADIAVQVHAALPDRQQTAEDAAKLVLSSNLPDPLVAEDAEDVDVFSEEYEGKHAAEDEGYEVLDPEEARPQNLGQ